MRSLRAVSLGNLFAPGSLAYVCSGNPTQAERADRIFTQRVCTQASGRRRADGGDLSRCGFVVTSPCSDPASLYHPSSWESELM